MQKLMWVGLAICACVIVILVLIGQYHPEAMEPSETNPSERIKTSCEREFGMDTPQANDCRIRLSVEYLEKAEREQMDRARRGAN